MALLVDTDVPIPVELVRELWGEIDGQTVLRIDVQPNPTQMYLSESTKSVGAGNNILRTRVRIHGSARALEGRDLAA